MRENIRVPPPPWVMSYELNRENLGDITRASHELLHRLTIPGINVILLGKLTRL